MQHDNSVDVIAHRLQTFPNRWKGCSQQELVKLGLCCTLPTFVITGILGSVWLGGVFGFMVVGALGFGLGGGFMALGASLLGRYKAKKPLGFVGQRWGLFLHRTGIKRSPLLVRSGRWMVGRKV